MFDNRNLILALTAILFASTFSATGVSKTLFDGMNWYHSADPAGRLSINEHGYLVWKCFPPTAITITATCVSFPATRTPPIFITSTSEKPPTPSSCKPSLGKRYYHYTKIQIIRHFLGGSALKYCGILT